MQLRLPSLLLVCALTALAGSVAHGEDEQAPTLEVLLVNNAKTKGSSFTARGKTLPLPDGTQLTISFGALSKTRNYVCKITRAVVTGNRYQVSEAWPSKRLAPVTYRVRVELHLKKQPPKIQQWIMTEYGYVANHREIVQHQDKTLGNDQESAKFLLHNLDVMDSFLRDLHKHLGVVRVMVSKPASEQPDWRKQKKAINKALRRFRSSVDKHFGAYVVMLEQGLRKRIQLAGTDISNLVRAHGRSQRRVPETMASLEQELKTLAELISERRPASEQQPLLPEDDEGQGE